MAEQEIAEVYVEPEVGHPRTKDFPSVALATSRGSLLGFALLVVAHAKNIARKTELGPQAASPFAVPGLDPEKTTIGVPRMASERGGDSLHPCRRVPRTTTSTRSTPSTGHCRRAPS